MTSLLALSETVDKLRRGKGGNGLVFGNLQIIWFAWKSTAMGVEYLSRSLWAFRHFLKIMMISKPPLSSAKLRRGKDSEEQPVLFEGRYTTIALVNLKDLICCGVFSMFV